MRKFYFSLLISLLCGLTINAQTTINLCLDLNATSCNASPPTGSVVGFLGFLNVGGVADPDGEELYILTDPDGDGVFKGSIFVAGNNAGLYLQGVYSVDGVTEDVSTVNKAACGNPPTNSALGRDQFAFNTTVNKPTDYWETCGNSACNALPVQLISFKAEKNAKGAVSLQWETASELNNDYFLIEYSTDGNRFEALGKVNGQGTTITLNNYDFTHEAPAAKINYYRLKQVDYDGRFEYSDVVAIKMDVDHINITPTIAKDRIQVQYNGAEVEVIIFNLNGRKVSQQRKNFENGSQELSVVDLPNGIYFLSIVDQKNVPLQGARFIKQ